MRFASLVFAVIVCVVSNAAYGALVPAKYFILVADNTLQTGYQSPPSAQATPEGRNINGAEAYASGFGGGGLPTGSKVYGNAGDTQGVIALFQTEFMVTSPTLIDRADVRISGLAWSQISGFGAIEVRGMINPVNPNDDPFFDGNFAIHNVTGNAQDFAQVWWQPYNRVLSLKLDTPYVISQKVDVNFNNLPGTGKVGSGSAFIDPDFSLSGLNGGASVALQIADGSLQTLPDFPDVQAPIPVPASLPLMFSAIAGLLGWQKSRRGHC